MNKDLIELRERHQKLYKRYWELYSEKLTLEHENKLLREGHIPDSASWILMKIAAQRVELRRLRKKLGYQDEGQAV